MRKRAGDSICLLEEVFRKIFMEYRRVSAFEFPSEHCDFPTTIGDSPFSHIQGSHIVHCLEPLNLLFYSPEPFGVEFVPVPLSRVQADSVSFQGPAEFVDRVNGPLGVYPRAYTNMFRLGVKPNSFVFLSFRTVSHTASVATPTCHIRL